MHFTFYNYLMSGFAVIGGSQAYDLLSRGAIHGKRLGPRKTPFGPSQPIYVIQVDSQTTAQPIEFLFLSRHGERGYETSAPFVNYRANIYALKDMGVNRIIAWSGPGAINPRYKVGQFVVVDDLIDETQDRQSTFFEKGGLGFIRQSPVFCPALRGLLVEVLKGQGLDPSDKGVYVCTQGPRLETPAEIKKFASYGGELVGMTLVPEVFLARELEMCYAALCYVSNYAEGVVKREFKAGELFEGLSSQEDKAAVARAVAQFPNIILEAARRLASQSTSGGPVDPTKCQCQAAMERYRREGRIGGDWRRWIKK
ncbi:MAG TPA: MTAP family purine nucleoside phosphorylase [Candidatus Tripitaka sp. YC43]